MGRGPGYEGDIRAEIIRLADRNWSATRIRDELGRLPAFSGRDLPDLRTVQRYVAKRTVEKGAAWTSTDASPDEVRAVIEVLAATMEESDGATTTISRDEAAWIVKIRSTVPLCPAPVVWRFMKDYRAITDRTHLDVALAVATKVRRLPSGGFDLDASHIARHVKLHVDRWIDRPLVFWAGSKQGAEAYIDEMGKHASLVRRGDSWGYLSRPGQYSWYDEHYFGRLIIDLGKGAHR